LVGVITISSGLLIGGWALLHPRRHDPFPFLAGHDLVAVAVVPPGTWGPKEARLYSWREPWTSVAMKARHELPVFGLKERTRKKRDLVGATWMGGHISGNGLEGVDAELGVEVLPGRARELHSTGKLSDGDPKWVTVIVVSDLEDNWINILRYTTFPIPEK
jgi:hypothetical protein